MKLQRDGCVEEERQSGSVEDGKGKCCGSAAPALDGSMSSVNVEMLLQDGCCSSEAHAAAV